MTYDVAVVGHACLDLILEGLPDIPRPGEELEAERLHSTVGGAPTVAIGAQRLGLQAALIGPKGLDPAGQHLRSLVEREGVDWIGPETDHSTVTVIMPVHGDRAMASVHSPFHVDASAVARVRSRSYVTWLHRVDLMPPDASLYVATSHGSVAHARTSGADLPQVRALLTNEAEALHLTRRHHVRDAVQELALSAHTAVITRGAAGAIAASGNELIESPAYPSTVRNTTGAGDLFIAAYVWADLRGLPLLDRLRWAALYASSSIGAPTALDGALHLPQLMDAGRKVSLSIPETRYPA